MNSYWVITWWDGITLRETMVGMCSPYDVTSAASGAGINVFNIIKIQKVPQP